MTGGLTVDRHNEPAATYKHGNATVRIHAGKMTKEERQQAFEQASRKMRREMEKNRRKGQ
jgi:hypothetical protein